MVTITPVELGQFLDAVASAPVALRDVQRINGILVRLVDLANSPGPIGVVPVGGHAAEPVSEPERV